MKDLTLEQIEEFVKQNQNVKIRCIRSAYDAKRFFINLNKPKNDN